ncbi:MAG: hypothetical protein HOW73_10415 [Polyangiaceae bacterium]|nr:hypothetical protein [Polyangiaceae bacterium]
MKTKKQFRLASLVVALGAVTAPLAIAGAGCDGSNPLGAICCEDFKPGTNMLEVDWGIDDATLNARFGVAIQAIGDFSGAATGMVTDLGTLCRNMAVELGEDPNSVTTADPGEYTTQWCAKASAQLSTISAELTISYQPAQCTFSAEVQASCEGHCDVEGGCTPGSVEVRCTEGELSVKCEGELSCHGKCEGSANVAVTCDGTCQGECEGTCQGNQNGGQCEGTCQGKCRGSCDVSGSAGVTCEGECVGEAACSGTATAPKCTGTLDPPECNLDADCEASCEASASAKAECTPPAVSIEGSETLSAKIAVLKKYLPEIIVIGEARAKLLVDQAEVMVEVSGNLDAALEGDGKAVFCIIPAGVAIADALANIQVSFEAAGNIVTQIQ